jgi:hypothetical protein
MKIILVHTKYKISLVHFVIVYFSILRHQNSHFLYFSSHGYRYSNLGKANVVALILLLSLLYFAHPTIVSILMLALVINLPAIALPHFECQLIAIK